MQQKTLGVIGGLGLETGQRFCSNVATRVREATNAQPSIICHIVNIPGTLEADLVYGKASEDHLSILNNSIRMLCLSGADSIAIPCNTVHVFFDRMKATSKVPLFSIIEETSRRIASMHFNAVGILASSTAINAGLYQTELSRRGIRAILPAGPDQETISRLIFDILNGNPMTKSVPDSIGVIRKMENAGAEAIVLGCTDLRLAGLRSKTPIIDSTAVLEDAAVRYLANGFLSR